ncbi:hypothetical protein [Bradyrhizobium sp. ARR65]|uniref:hypothetical protein n=1 Tax=Bradyrhizobium sp. ARR65 TaxID=1040989 RepID=UPI000463014E|nr:hypothetical protein [Bradyrhizobium sp. ARR65]
MHSSSECPHHHGSERCAICGGKFGLIRHYSWRTALCSSRCLDQFRARRERDRRWLFRFQAYEEDGRNLRSEFAASMV